MIKLFIRRRLVKLCFSAYVKKKKKSAPCILKGFRAKTDLSLPLNQVCAFWHPHKAFQIWFPVARRGKNHGYQIIHRDLQKPNSKYFQRFRLLRLAQLLPIIRLSIHHSQRMTEQSLAGCTRGQTRGYPLWCCPWALQWAAEMRHIGTESRKPVPPELECNSGLPNVIVLVLLASFQHSFSLPLAWMYVENWTTSTLKALSNHI